MSVGLTDEMSDREMEKWDYQSVQKFLLRILDCMQNLQKYAF